MLRSTLLSLLVCLSLSACANGIGDQPDVNEDEGGGGDSEGFAILEGSELAAELVDSPTRAAPVEFRRVGVLWTGDEENALEIQTSADGGSTWSRWFTPSIRSIEVERTSSFLGELILEDGAATHYRLRGTRNQRPNYLRLEFFSRASAADAELTGDTVPAASLGSLSQSLSIGSVQVIGKGAWGGRASNCNSAHSPSRITIHHTVTPNNDQLSPEARLRQIQKDHQGSRGWCDIGYHFIVSQDGRIFEGTPVGVRGTHTAKNNTNNVGISFLGNFESAQPNGAQIDAGARLVAALSQTYGISLNVGDTLRGHRDWKSTACPGQNMYNSLEEIASIARGGGSTQQPPPPPPVPDQVAVRGIVFEAGSPSQRISGATVSVSGMTATTDANGEYRVSLSPGMYQIAVSAPGFAPATVTRTLSADGTFGSVGLSPVSSQTGSAGIQGIVHRQYTAERFEGVVVFIDGGRQTTTDEKGYYRFEDLAPGTHAVTANVPGVGSGTTTRTLANGEMEWANVPVMAGTPEQTAPPAPAASCQGWCASPQPVAGSNPECFCDDECAALGDCCGDKAQVCGSVTATATCKGSCFTDSAVAQGDDVCYCDASCTQFGDCCADFSTECTNPPAASCQGMCGSPTPLSQAGQACYCDSLCTENGDCCADFAARCSTGGESLCQGRCGDPVPQDDGGFGCYCDLLCIANGDCCPGYTSTCL